MLLLIAAGAVIDRVVAARLFAHPTQFVPAYRAFPEYAVGDKLHHFEATKTHWSGLFVGNSRTVYGLDPASVDRTLATRGDHLRSYNLAFPSVDPRFWSWFFQHYYDRPLPRHVFLGVLPRDLDARNRGTDQFIEHFRASPGAAHRHMSSTNQLAEEELAHLFTLRGRGVDLRGITVSDVIHGRKLDIPVTKLVGDQGYSVVPKGVYRPLVEKVAQQRLLSNRHGRLRFELGPQWQSILALDAFLRQRGSCLTLYTTPVLYDKEIWGTVEMRRGFYAALGKLLRASPGIGFVDTGRQVEPSLGPTDYSDGDHLAPVGVRKFSSALGSSLAPLVRSGCQAR